ncbi:hypothetical protein FNL39_104191 [Nocardia caishijiensis]|uniref:Uncharacterized protein n=1 Tax=Nocardia caishijiensis TaxID=184756 RepID=A0ABQ6YMM7_9NOCA|nr:hypothetical protein FNL39_104191 [Nocardia caishijiensis]
MKENMFRRWLDNSQTAWSGGRSFSEVSVRTVVAIRTRGVHESGTTAVRGRAGTYRENTDDGAQGRFRRGFEYRIAGCQATSPNVPPEGV